MGEDNTGNTFPTSGLLNNVDGMLRLYPINNGLFGVQGLSRDPSIRNIVSDAPLETATDFYLRISSGGVEQPLLGGNGVRTTLVDGSVITFRKVSTSDGSPAISINVRRSTGSGEIRSQKIHFVIRREAR